MNTHQKRILDLQLILKEKQLDAIVLARPLEIDFLTGYFMDGVLMLITRQEAFAFMPKMLFDDFRAKVPFVRSEHSDKIREALMSKKTELGLKKAVFEPETENYLRGKYWKDNGFEECQGLTAGLRLCKEGEEIEMLRKSCRIASKAFEQLVPTIKTGETEIEVSNRLDNLMRSMGAKGPSFDLIVAFGQNGALPHHVTSERKLKDNEPILIDFGCVYKGYCSDITRTFFHGTPNDEYRKVYDIVLKAHDEGLKALKPGLSAVKADKICRDIISDAGYGQYFIHSTGHGVGLEIHEAPSLNPRADEKCLLKKGMAVTIEPGIYLLGKFGVRIEDTALITESGCEALTASE